MAEMKRIDVDQAEKLASEKPNLLILDMREGRDYRQQHHPDALNVGDHNLRTLLMKGDKSRPVLVYCYLGNSSQDMAKMFCDFGYNEVYSLDGGFTAWKKRLDGEGSSDSAGQEAAASVPKRVDAQNELGMTALMIACRDGDYAQVVGLLAQGADPNITNVDGNGALWLACYADEPRILSLLLEHDAFINHQNTTGATALIYAASAGKTAMVELLLAAGADPELMTQDDFTALDLAANRPILSMLSRTNRQQLAG